MTQYPNDHLPSVSRTYPVATAPGTDLNVTLAPPAIALFVADRRKLTACATLLYNGPVMMKTLPVRHPALKILLLFEHRVGAEVCYYDTERDEKRAETKRCRTRGRTRAMPPTPPTR